MARGGAARGYCYMSERECSGGSVSRTYGTFCCEQNITAVKILCLFAAVILYFLQRHGLFAGLEFLPEEIQAMFIDIYCVGRYSYVWVVTY